MLNKEPSPDIGDGGRARQTERPGEDKSGIGTHFSGRAAFIVQVPRRFASTTSRPRLQDNFRVELTRS
jgi:hypothetical protein